MKKIILSAVSFAIGAYALAQPTLKYETHSLKSGADNPMTLCEYMEPGISGQGTSWDFSGIKALKEFTGEISDMPVGRFDYANTQLVEFTTHFFFDITEDGMKQVGYASGDNRTQVEYTEPFEKMRFPFSYEDNYSAPFSGSYYYNNNKFGDISGVGSVEADACGKLILPGKTYESTVRIKTVKSYTIKYSQTSETSVEITTFRWYNETHRYPLLVLTEYKTISGTHESVNHQAAYNNKAVNFKRAEPVQLIAEEEVNVYPNPVLAGELFLDINSDNNTPAFVSISDITGKTIISEIEKALSEGKNTVDLSSELSMLKAGTYLLNVRKGRQVVVKEIVVAE